MENTRPAEGREHLAPQARVWDKVPTEMNERHTAGVEHPAAAGNEITAGLGQSPNIMENTRHAAGVELPTPQTRARD